MKTRLRQNRSIFVLVLATLAIVTGVLVMVRLQSMNNSEQLVVNTVAIEDSEFMQGNVEKRLIRVDISGEVKNPGVYEFQEGEIFDNAINKAGGFTDEVDLEYVAQSLNRAQRLQDEQKIYIPAKGVENNGQTEGSVEGGSSVGQEQSGKINVNSASSEELESLSGIGHSYAVRIIEGRPYIHIEDIKNVKGIGDATFEKIKDFITV